MTAASTTTTLDARIAALPEDLRDAARANSIECTAQGLPVFVDDPVALERCARILATPAVVGDVEEIAS
jgi:hypothetical protein